MDTRSALIRQGGRSHRAAAWGRPAACGAAMPAASGRGASEVVSVEAAMEGPLPTVGGAWVLQYAGAMARLTGEPVGVLHLADGIASAQAVAPTAQAVPHVAPRVPVSHPGGFSEFIRTARRRDVAPLRRWLVRLGAPGQGLGRAVLSDLGAWTVISGAEPANVRGTSALLDELQRRGPTRQLRRLGLAWMGAKPRTCLRAHRTLEARVSHRLRKSLALIACQPRLEPIIAVPLGRCENAVLTWWCCRPWLVGAARSSNEARASSRATWRSGQARSALGRIGARTPAGA